MAGTSTTEMQTRCGTGLSSCEGNSREWRTSRDKFEHSGPYIVHGQSSHTVCRHIELTGEDHKEIWDEVLGEGRAFCYLQTGKNVLICPKVYIEDNDTDMLGDRRRVIEIARRLWR